MVGQWTTVLVGTRGKVFEEGNPTRDSPSGKEAGVVLHVQERSP